AWFRAAPRAFAVWRTAHGPMPSLCMSAYRDSTCKGVSRASFTAPSRGRRWLVTVSFAQECRFVASGRRRRLGPSGSFPRVRFRWRQSRGDELCRPKPPKRRWLVKFVSAPPRTPPPARRETNCPGQPPPDPPHRPILVQSRDRLLAFLEGAAAHLG